MSRKKSSRTPIRRFTIFCEGQNTEPAYFQALQDSLRNRVQLDIRPAVGAPMTIATKAAAEAKPPGRKRDSFEEHDQIWAVFDKDDHPRFDEAVRLCEEKRVGVARSNPCFEVWLILHRADYDRPDHRDDVQTHLRSLCPEYDPGKGKLTDCRRLLGNLNEALHRARVQLNRRLNEGAAFGPPSTTVVDLIEAIQDAARLSAPKS